MAAMAPFQAEVVLPDRADRVSVELKALQEQPERVRAGMAKMGCPLLPELRGSPAEARRE
jgi:hypothetical protein